MKILLLHIWGQVFAVRFPANFFVMNHFEFINQYKDAKDLTPFNK